MSFFLIYKKVGFTMVDFITLYTEYEQTKNVCKFCKDYSNGDVAIRFLLIRSLDKDNLKDIIRAYSNENTDGNIRFLTEKAYNSAVTIEQLESYIETKRLDLIQQRERELYGLADILASFPALNCGVRNDKVDDIIKSFVRNKSLKTMDELKKELDINVLPRIRQYSLWSYYNQTSNDIIELFFLKHPKVILTLRKIHDIDFFIKVGDLIIPFDLKITHISDSYFDLASQGIFPNKDASRHDDFYVNKNSSTNEIKQIKVNYSKFKRTLNGVNLPNIGKLEKNDLCNYLLMTGDEEAIRFVNQMKLKHASFVPSSSDELYPLEWWNYKYQGERLFCNNNRLFVFLSYTDKFVDGRELKGKTVEIGKRINHLLDNLKANDWHTVRYHYDKEASLVGDYAAFALSTIYTE